MIPRRYGKVYIRRKFLDDLEVMRAVSRRLIIIRAEMTYYYDAMEYTAYCDDFDLLDDGFIVPEYDVEITPLDTEVVVRFTRRSM